MTRPIPLQNCSTSWVLSGFADEAGGTTAEQVAAIRRAGRFRHVDLRGIDGFNIARACPWPTPQAVRRPVRYRRHPRRHVRLARKARSISPTTSSPRLQKLDHLGRLSEVTRPARPVRTVFSYYNKHKQPAGVWERESLGRLARLARAGRPGGLVLYHENEAATFSATSSTTCWPDRRHASATRKAARAALPA